MDRIVRNLIQQVLEGYETALNIADGVNGHLKSDE